MPPNLSRRQMLAGAGALALAGCTDLFGDGEAVTPSPSPSPTSEPEELIPVQGEGIPVDVDRVWVRVTGLMEVDVDPPERVVTTYDSRSGGSWVRIRPFLARLVGVDEGGSSSWYDETSYGTASSDGDTVRVLLGGLSVEAVELALAHGFVRTIQMRKGWTRMQLMEEHIPEMTVLDGVVMGSALYAEAAYADRHLEEHPRPPEELLDSPPTLRYFFLDRYYGHRYVDWRIDSPAEIGEIHDDPPRTSEQLIHRLPNDHGPASLRVRVEEGAEWNSGRERTWGELFVRAALQAHLDRERANEASTGWGNDRHVRFRTFDGKQGDVFVTRWDEPADADTFEAAMAEFLSERAEPTDDGWHDADEDEDDDLRFELERASEDVVVLTVGPDAFVRGVTIDADDADVTVAVE